MKRLLNIQKQLVPDILEVLTERFRILRFIRLMQPIGRRSLATSLGMSERVLRSEVTFLKEQRLIHIASSGMTLTEQGQTLHDQLEEMMREVFDLKELEKQLKQILGLKKVLIVPGDSDQYPTVKKELGKACVQLIKQLQPSLEKKIIAVTGGTTVAEVAEMMTPDSDMKETLFVPARGGLGEQVENQANTICAAMATKAMGSYRLLHVPDQLSPESYASLMEEPTLKELQSMIRSAEMVVHGIGEATTMAKRRNSSNEMLHILQEKNAVAEAFGYYFNQTGDIIHKVLTIGLQLEDVTSTKYVIAVAGGSTKAKAISAYMKQKASNILVTDEGAALELLQICS